MIKSGNLEKKLWYRFLKVIYITGILFITGIALFGLYIFQPISVVDLSKSSFTCPDGKSYLLSQANGTYKKSDQFLDMQDHLSSLRTCKIYPYGFNVEKAKEVGYTDNEINEYRARSYDENSDEFKRNFASIESGRKNPAYRLNLFTNDTNMEWVKVILGSLAFFTVAVFILNLIRDVILYIIIGKKFSFLKVEIETKRID